MLEKVVEATDMEETRRSEQGERRIIHEDNLNKEETSNANLERCDFFHHTSCN